MRFGEDVTTRAQARGGVRKPISETIEKLWGAQRHVHKKKDEVEGFFRVLSAQVYQSEWARNYRKRVQK